MPLFGVAVLEQPTKKEREDGKSERLLFGPEWDTGADGQAVALKILLSAQQNGKLWWFSVYCLIIGSVVFAIGKGWIGS